MINVNPIGQIGPEKPLMSKVWKPGGWAIALFLAWLALLAVPMVGLFNLDAFSPVSADRELKPWMPIHPPIV